MTKLDFPDTPSTGQQFGSSGTVWRWDGTRWGSTAGAAGARGAVGYAQITTVLTGLTNIAAVPGLAVTFTADPARRYRIMTQVQCLTDTVTQGITLTINQAGQKARQDTGPQAQANAAVGLNAFTVVSGISGSVTFQACLGRTYGSTGTVSLISDPTYPAFIVVEDITYEAGSGGPTLDRVAYGQLAYAESRIITNFNGVPKEFLRTPAIVLPLNRRVKVTFSVNFQKNAPDLTEGISVFVGFDSGNQLAIRGISMVAPGAFPFHIEIPFNVNTYFAGGGSHSFFLNIWTTSGYLNAAQDTYNPAWSSVEDIGPAF